MIHHLLRIACGTGLLVFLGGTDNTVKSECRTRTSCSDEEKYRLFQNNCECFVNWAISNQVENRKWVLEGGIIDGSS